MCSIEFAELKRIDALLQCGICYDYMDTSVITSCSHNYCSLCIRKYLLYKTQCPICSEKTFEKDLRRNKLLDEIIIHYLNFKEKYDKKPHYEKLLTTRDESSGVVCSTNNFEYKKEQGVKVSHKTYDSPTLTAGNVTPPGRKNYQQDVSTPSTSTDFRIPRIFTPKGRKGFQKEEHQVVSCPVCKVEVSQNNINKHLDDCLKRENTDDQPEKSEPKRKPLPKLVLCLMKDNVIRRRLRELGLSIQGDRKALKNRLQRYTVLYNAECDKTYPRPISELIKQCEEEEDLEKKIQKPSNSVFANVTRNTQQNIIEQKRKEYLAINKDSFDQLIARVKEENSPQKISVRRNILNEENSDISCDDRVAEHDLIIDNDQRMITDFLPLNSADYIDDSNSNTTYPLQSYSSENPMNFLSVELGSSRDSTDQCTFNDNISNHLNESSPDLLNTSIKTENIKIEKLSSENILHEEITSTNPSRQCDVLENEMDIDTIKSISQFTNMKTENKKQIRLSNRNRSITKQSSEKRVVHSEPTDKWQKKLHNENIDSIVEDTEHSDVTIFEDNIDIQDDDGRSNYEQLNKAMEDYTPGIKSEKENMKALDKDLTRDLRKREREMAFALSDEEKVDSVGRTMSTKKLFRIGLSEAKGFNNETFGETGGDEGRSQSEKEQAQVTCMNNIRNCTRKSLKLRNKMSNDRKINKIS